MKSCLQGIKWSYIKNLLWKDFIHLCFILYMKGLGVYIVSHYPWLRVLSQSLWSLKMSIKLLILYFGLRLFGGLQQFALSRCFRFAVMLGSLIQCENTLLLLADCRLSTICMAAHFWFAFLTATCSCCGEDLPRSLHKNKSRQQEQEFITITSYMRPCKQQRYFFARGIAQVLISSLLITAWLLGRSTECS